MRIREFNNALLGKWCSILLVERESLWCKVLSARYGVVWRAAVCWMEGVMPLLGGALSLLYVGRGGLVTMLVERWEMGREQCFG